MAKHSREALDSRDREILRFLLNAKRAVSGHFVASRLIISAPSIKPRLETLQKMGYIRKSQTGKSRCWNNPKDHKSKITAPSRILWELDLRDDTSGQRGAK